MSFHRPHAGSSGLSACHAMPQRVQTIASCTRFTAQLGERYSASASSVRHAGLRLRPLRIAESVVR
jgi:hypothetical protein